MLLLVNCSEFSPFLTRNRPSSFVRRVCVWGDTVSVTGFSVAQTGFSVAQSVAAECVFRPSPCFCPSICAAAAVHVVGGKTHVFAHVCNNFRRQLRATRHVVNVVPVVVPNKKHDNSNNHDNFTCCTGRSCCRPK